MRVEHAVRAAGVELPHAQRAVAGPRRAEHEAGRAGRRVQQLDVEAEQPVGARRVRRHVGGRARVKHADAVGAPGRPPRRRGRDARDADGAPARAGALKLVEAAPLERPHAQAAVHAAREQRARTAVGGEARDRGARGAAHAPQRLAALGELVQIVDADRAVKAAGEDARVRDLNRLDDVGVAGVVVLLLARAAGSGGRGGRGGGGGGRSCGGPAARR